MALARFIYRPHLGSNHMDDRYLIASGLIGLGIDLVLLSLLLCAVAASWNLKVKRRIRPYVILDIVSLGIMFLSPPT